jgi:hypothetical protein
MKNVKLLTNGFFENPEKISDESTQLSPYNIRKNFDKVLFYFELNTCFDYNLKFDCGYFSPKDEITYFHLKEEKTTAYNEYKIINIQPSFFVFSLPYPMLYFNINNKHQEKSFPLDYKTNPFINQIILKKDRENRFSNEIVDSDLSKNYRIHILEKEHPSVNSFTGNNCYPLFLQDINEVKSIADEYRGFLNEVLGFEIGVNSLSKIIIPFFDIDEFNKINGEYIEDDWPFS